MGKEKGQNPSRKENTSEKEGSHLPKPYTYGGQGKTRPGTAGNKEFKQNGKNAAGDTKNSMVTGNRKSAHVARSSDAKRMKKKKKHNRGRVERCQPGNWDRDQKDAKKMQRSGK